MGYVEKIKDVDPELRSALIDMNEYKVTDEDFKDANVIDIGANIGLFTGMAIDGGAKRVISIEPSNLPYEKLFETFKDEAKVVILKNAIAGSRRKVYIMGNDTHGQVYELANVITNEDNSVMTLTMDDIFNISIPDDEDVVLKIDVEGSEHEALYAMSSNAWSRVKSLHIEIHGFPPNQPSDVEAMKRYIYAKGFTLMSEIIPKSWNVDEKGEVFNVQDMPVSICRFNRGMLGVASESVEIGSQATPTRVTATICTRGRYETTFPMALMSLLMQTKLPDQIIIYDDNTPEKRIDMRNNPTFQCLFLLMNQKKIEWEVVWGSGEGQVKNHQHAYEHAKHPFIFRMDDDDVLEPNVLEELAREMDSVTGAVAGLIPFVRSMGKMHPRASNKIEDIYDGMNIQWFFPETDEVMQVDHLNQSFLYRKEATHGYCKELSRIGHREETMLTYDIKCAGWDVKVNPKAVTWHFHSDGGIRDDSKAELWKHDEEVFSRYLKEKRIKIPKVFTAVLNSGLGDHYMFLTILPQILEKYRGYDSYRIMLYVCYPHVFNHMLTDPNIILLSIADAIQAGINMDDHNVYIRAMDMGWRGHLTEIFKKMYL
jgi:FkbM family methyltransferase